MKKRYVLFFIVLSFCLRNVKAAAQEDDFAGFFAGASASCVDGVCAEDSFSFGLTQEETAAFFQELERKEALNREALELTMLLDEAVSLDPSLFFTDTTTPYAVIEDAPPAPYMPSSLYGEFAEPTVLIGEADPFASSTLDSMPVLDPADFGPAVSAEPLFVEQSSEEEKHARNLLDQLRQSYALLEVEELKARSAADFKAIYILEKQLISLKERVFDVLAKFQSINRKVTFNKKPAIREIPARGQVGSDDESN